jgi:hypothetical protein
MAGSERATARGRWLVAVVALFAASCIELPGGEEERKGDGARCKADDECRSGTCTTAEMCAHSSCECGGNTCEAGGEPARQCGDGWVCTDAEGLFDGVQEFFGGEPREDKGYCHPLCSEGCPEHYTCDGTLCVMDTTWNEPVPSVTWSGAVSGEAAGKGASAEVQLEFGKTVKLVATATSPSGRAVESFTWMYVGGVSETIEGPELEVTLLETDSWRRADLYVADDQARSSMLSVVFTGCLGQGATCGYDGSGCCGGCDRTANTCL